MAQSFSQQGARPNLRLCLRLFLGSQLNLVDLISRLVKGGGQADGAVMPRSGNRHRHRIPGDTPHEPLPCCAYVLAHRVKCLEVKRVRVLLVVRSRSRVQHYALSLPNRLKFQGTWTERNRVAALMTPFITKGGPHFICIRWLYECSIIKIIAWVATRGGRHPPDSHPLLCNTFSSLFFAVGSFAKRRKGCCLGTVCD